MWDLDVFDRGFAASAAVHQEPPQDVIPAAADFEWELVKVAHNTALFAQQSVAGLGGIGEGRPEIPRCCVPPSLIFMWKVQKSWEPPSPTSSTSISIFIGTPASSRFIVILARRPSIFEPRPARPRVRRGASRPLAILNGGGGAFILQGLCPSILPSWTPSFLPPSGSASRSKLWARRSRSLVTAPRLVCGGGSAPESQVNPSLPASVSTRDFPMPARPSTTFLCFAPTVV